MKNLWSNGAWHRKKAGDFNNAAGHCQQDLPSVIALQPQVAGARHAPCF
ncbi:MAG: hypothetical protein QMB92_06695 [Thiopseudomonas sp.]|nr:hypothetical protein [Gammaproteobacteria bacterium]